MNDEENPLIELAEDPCQRSWKAPERYRQARCAECHAPLSTYNPNTICEPCRERLKRGVLPRGGAVQVERFWAGYLLKLHQREPVAH
jgi:predicted amidophosphoribosyltransferase